MVCMGFINVLNPNVMKKMISFWRKGKNIYAGALLRVLFGVIFLWSVTQARLPWVIYILGILMLLGAALIFILGLEKTKKILDWWDKKPHSVLRLIAILILAIGVLVIYSA
jgi:small-conductance mechanosensitive channel